ncbi:MAG: hypothetical protein Kilf2KO_29220 [Rhodospirillales bacterium]
MFDPPTRSDRNGRSVARRAVLATAVGLAALALTPGLAPQAADIQLRWQTVDETGEDFAEAERQARASIYRGDHLLAVRCHSDAEKSWLTLVFSATWFVRPKERPRLTLSIDEEPGQELSFERETDYRFVAVDPPRRLLEQLASGSEATVAGPDYEGAPVALPLKGSRRAIDEALALCGSEPLPDPK